MSSLFTLLTGGWPLDVVLFFSCKWRKHRLVAVVRPFPYFSPKVGLEEVLVLECVEGVLFPALGPGVAFRKESAMLAWLADLVDTLWLLRLAQLLLEVERLGRRACAKVDDCLTLPYVCVCALVWACFPICSSVVVLGMLLRVISFESVSVLHGFLGRPSVSWSLLGSSIAFSALTGLFVVNALTALSL